MPPTLFPKLFLCLTLTLLFNNFSPITTNDSSKSAQGNTVEATINNDSSHDWRKMIASLLPWLIISFGFVIAVFLLLTRNTLFKNTPSDLSLSKAPTQSTDSLNTPWDRLSLPQITPETEQSLFRVLLEAAKDPVVLLISAIIIACLLAFQLFYNPTNSPVDDSKKKKDTSQRKHLELLPGAGKAISAFLEDTPADLDVHPPDENIRYLVKIDKLREKAIKRQEEENKRATRGKKEKSSKFKAVT